MLDGREVETMNDVGEIHHAIESSSLAEMKRELYAAAVRYAHIRANWNFMPQDERIARSRERTIAHDALIDACNILSRNMANAGEDNSWRAKIGEDRQEIGDFACRLHCLFGLAAR